MVVVLVILFLAGVGVGGYFGWKHFHKAPVKKVVQEVKILDTISEYDYSISDKDSKYFQSEYAELKKILLDKPVNEEKYATQVAKMFVIDLYSLGTKINKYDIGGNEFFYSDKKEMFEQKVIDTLYSTMLDDTYGDRKQTLPIVKNVEVISTTKQTYKLGSNGTNGYLVKMNITYEQDYKYDKEASVVVVKEGDIKWSVVDLQPTLSPKYK